MQKIKTNSQKARYNNKNAKGNKGGNPPNGNKNALKTGEHERIAKSTLTPEEEAIMNADINPLDEMLMSLKFLKIRQQRIEKRLEDIYTYTDKETAVEGIKRIKGIQGGFDVDITETTEQALFNREIKLEDALTRVVTSKAKLARDVLKAQAEEQHLNQEPEPIIIIDVGE